MDDGYSVRYSGVKRSLSSLKRMNPTENLPTGHGVCELYSESVQSVVGHTDYIKMLLSKDHAYIMHEAWRNHDRDDCIMGK